MVGGLAIKLLSDTRWESHLESIKAIHFQAPKIRDALFYLAETRDDPKTRSDAECLATSETHVIGGFKFLFGMVIWYEILAAINYVSKTLQTEHSNINDAIDQLKGLVYFLKKYRERGSEEAKAEAKNIAVVMDVEPVFHVKKKRIIKKKTHFDEEQRQEVDDNMVLSEEDRFRVDYIIKIMDQTIVSLKTRLKQFEEYEKTFGFLFDPSKLCSMSNGEHSDIDGDVLFLEIKFFREIIQVKEMKKAFEVLTYTKRFEHYYPNIWNAYRIMFTLSITIASAERSFSKLKLIKSYLRSTMSQERLNGLVMLSIEKDIVKNLDYERLMDDFA